MKREILVINCGSSSIKFSLFNYLDDLFTLALHGQIHALGLNAQLTFKDPAQSSISRVDIAPSSDHAAALQAFLHWLEPRLDVEAQLIVGHRVVHGGSHYHRPTLVNETVLDKLKDIIPLAPLHLPHNILAIERLAQLRPDLTQVACFDTAFHSTQGRITQQFAIPDEYYDQGLRSYGFHGLSYDYIATHIKRIDPQLAAGKLVVAHLGNGASLCAIENGRSVDCTMSFSTLDGLVMGTRSGALDPGVILYLLQEKNMSPAEVSDLLYTKSGLLGLSNQSSDMRTLLDSDTPEAARAIAIYLRRLGREIAAMVSAMQGINGLIFTGGVGENSASIRQRVCHQLGWLGVTIDIEANSADKELISLSTSAVKLYVLKTNEEQVIAQNCVTLVI